MRSLKLLFFLAGLGLGLLAAPAAGQPGMGSDPAGDLERTDRILERAREQVGVSPSSRAGGLLEEAFKMQIRAKEVYDPRERATWKPAFQLTLQSRDLARRAVETAEIEVKAHESINDLIESTRELSQEATTIVRERGDPEARRLLDVGLWQLQRADEAYRSAEFRKAIRLAATARDLVQRAMQRARGDAPNVAVSVETAMDRTQALLEEVRVNLGPTTDPAARGLFDEAVRLQDRALQMHREKRPDLASRLTTQARRVALESLFLVSSRPEKEDVERALSVVEQLIQDASPIILESGLPDAIALLDSARQRAAESREQFAQGNASQALATARLAERLLHRAAEKAGSQ